MILDVKATNKKNGEVISFALETETIENMTFVTEVTAE